MSKSPNAGVVGAAGNPKKITQAFVGIAALTFAAGGGLAFWLNGQISSGQGVAAGKEKEVGSSEQIAMRLGATQAAYDRTRSRIADLESSVSEKSYVPTLLQQLQSLAATTHLTVMSVHPSAIAAPPPPPAPAKAAEGGSSGTGGGTDVAAKKKPAPPYDTMNVDLSVVGTYADTVTFLYDLTRFPKILSVEGAQFSPGGAPGQGAPGQGRPGQSKPGGQSAPQVTTQLKLIAFVFHDDAPSAPNAGGGVKTAEAVVPPPAAPTVAGA
ncbi:MAG: hypothetical protein JO250_06540, partial [Armatimonadetes bacterium]|nr:hypothetical protein [Armatimonadota bacterium]